MFFSDDEREQAKYIKSLIGLVGSILLTWALWSALIFFWKRKSNGCASGQGFRVEVDEFTAANSFSYGNDAHENERTFDDDMTDAKVDTFDESSIVTDETASFDGSKMCRQYHRSCLCSNDSKNVKQRKFCTRIFYFFFGILSLLCSFMVLNKMYYPIINAAENTSRVLEKVEYIIARAGWTIKVGRQTALTADEIRSDFALSQDQLCPMIPQEHFAHELGVDPTSIILFLDRDFPFFMRSAEGVISSFETTSLQIEMVLDRMEFGIQTVQDQLWILSLLFFLVMALTAVSLFSVLWAACQERFPSTYEEQDQTRMEQVMAWGILPFFFMATFLVWVLVAATSLSTTVITDVCLPSPDVTIQAFLQSQGVDTNSVFGISAASYLDVS